MTGLMRYAAQLEDAGERDLPPVHKWNPAYSGEIALEIKRDGTWIYEGSPIVRARLVRLFSTVLKYEDGAYYLVTPVEKLGIKVEDAPFIAVLMKTEGDGAHRRLIFTTNVGDQAVAGTDHEIVLRRNDATGDYTPYIHVRGGLEARIARAVFYDLVEFGETQDINGNEFFGIWSSGVFFPLGLAQDVFGRA